MASKTRSALKCPIFGAPTNISISVLPTFEDMNRYFDFVEHQLRAVSSNPQTTATESSKVVAQTIEDIWMRVSIPTVLQSTIIKRIKNFRLKIRNLLKSYKKKRNVPNYKQQLDDFRTQAKLLFDVAACKCPELLSCVCDKAFKVPVAERSFLKDQRSVRKMMIGPVDVAKTKQLQKRLDTIYNTELYLMRQLVITHEKTKDNKKDLDKNAV